MRLKSQQTKLRTPPGQSTPRERKQCKLISVFLQISKKKIQKCRFEEEVVVAEASVEAEEVIVVEAEEVSVEVEAVVDSE